MAIVEEHSLMITGFARSYGLHVGLGLVFKSRMPMNEAWAIRRECRFWQPDNDLPNCSTTYSEQQLEIIM